MEYMQHTYTLDAEQEYLVVFGDADGELVTAHPEVGKVLLPSPNVYGEQTPTVEVVTLVRSGNSSREDFLASLWIYRRAHFGKVGLPKDESARVLDDIFTAVPSLKGRARWFTYSVVCPP